jgi:hypothetical protein
VSVARAVEVRDQSQRLLFRHDPVARTTVVAIPDGDVRLELPNGGFTVVAGRGIDLQGARLDLRAAEARMSFGALELRAGRIVEHARNIYRRVEELCELRAGRLRALARDRIHLLADQLALRARATVRIDGEKVELG